MSRQTLRPYQQRAIEKVIEAVGVRKMRRVLIVAPTGAGKTTISAEFIHRAIAKGSRVVFLAHRKELISQCSKRLEQWGVDHGIVQAKHPRWAPMLPVQVASIETLRRRIASGKFDPAADIIIIDEAHRSTAPTYDEVIQAHHRFAAEHGKPNPVVLGLTATPVRRDGCGLGTRYDELILVAQPGELIADGFLIEPAIADGGTPDMTGIHTSGGEYVEREVAAAFAKKPKLVGEIADNWLRLVGRGRRTVVFASSVENSITIRDEFLSRGIPAAHIEGETPAEERDAALADLREGRIEVLTNCAILTEGWDLPLLDAVVLARITKSVGLYLQMVGRVLRTAEGKTRALVLDHGNHKDRLGWPTQDREWDLHTGEKKNGQKIVATKTCPNCGIAVTAQTRTCAACQYVWIPAERAPLEFVPGQLKEATREQTELDHRGRVIFLARATRDARLDGAPTGWNSLPRAAITAFEARVGRKPNELEIGEALRMTRSMRKRA